MSSYVRSRTFCCCLPVRLGVFILSLLAMVGGAFLAIYGWIQISQLKQHPLAKSDEIALWIQSVLFSFLAALAVFGFFGVMIKNRAMISGFAIALAIHLGFTIASGAFSIYTMFSRNSQAALDACVQGASDASAATTQSCKTGLVVFKAIMVVIYVFIWLIQLYAYFIVERYAEQLDDERLADKAVLVVPRTVVIEAGGPQVTTYAGFAPTYPFVGSQSTPRGQDPSNMA